MTSENTPAAPVADEAPAAREFTAPLSSTRRGAHLARLLAVRQLDAWGRPQDCEASAATAVIVAELAANAATHGRVPGRNFGLTLLLTARMIRIEVADTCSEGRPSPGPTPPAPDSETGRGLLLVAALATRWGVVDREGPGKTVWAEIEF